MQTPPHSDPYQQPPKKRNTWIWYLVGALAICGCGGVILIPAILLPVFFQARIAGARTRCLVHMKQLGLGQLMYTSDFDERLPLADSWLDTSMVYIKDRKVRDCPVVVTRGQEYGYAMNSANSGKKLAKIANPGTEILTYETNNLVANAAGNPKSEPPTKRHGKGRNEGFADGSARVVQSP